MFLQEMPEKFTKEKIDLCFKKIEMQHMDILAARMTNNCPNTTFRRLSIVQDPCQPVQVLGSITSLAKQIIAAKHVSLTNLVFNIA